MCITIFSSYGEGSEVICSEAKDDEQTEPQTKKVWNKRKRNKKKNIIIYIILLLFF